MGAGLTCARCVPRTLTKGLAAIRIDTLVALCGVLGVSPSQLLLVAEARSAGQEVGEHLGANNKQIRMLLEAGRFEPVTSKDAARGIRGQKADATRDETRRLQAEGLSKADIARQLGVTVRTVERYWVKPVTQE